MGLNPSCNLDEGLVGFPVLGDPPFKEERRDLAIEELRAAGFPRGSTLWTAQEVEVYAPGSEAAQLASAGIFSHVVAERSATEWVTRYSVEAELYGWRFRRAWYYWVARCDGGYPVSIDAALAFNEAFFKEARVDGYAGGKKVVGPVSTYHVDTPRGLKALVELITPKGR